ncbi:hypothetical protein OG474_24515 [Kribbella sp. NBC_01505]|uniref:hypothetical protein n=1 Tax=Kribbella sp. NBC_01505 TaxID=2903580 RepID=UPI00386D534C
MARRLPAAAVALMLLVSLAACGGKDKPSGLPTLTPGDNESSSAPTSTTGTPSAPSTPSSSANTLPDSIAVHKRKISTKTPAEAAVAEVFVRYITVRLTAYNKVAVDLDALAKSSTGAALTQVKGDVAGLKNRKQHSVGEVWIDISKIAISGSTATVTSCMDNTTVDVDAKGKPTSAPKPFYNIKSTVQLAGGKVWLVSAITFKGNVPCR